jgi:hypothetical protein
MKNMEEFLKLIVLTFIFACPVNRQQFCMLTKTNQKGQPITWSRAAGLSCAPLNDREFENSLRSNRVKLLFRSFMWCSAA